MLTGRLMATALHILDRYLPAVLSVIYANDLPEEGVGRVEKAA